MKKFILPSMMFVMAFIVGLLFQSHTFVQQGHLSLFLLAPDYFREVFGSPFPLSYLLSQFLLQFYDIPVAGAAMTALLITAVYCLSRSMTLACALWIYLSLSGNIQAVVALAFVAAAVRLVLWTAKVHIGKRPTPSWAMAGSAVLVVCSAVFICLSPSVRNREIRAAVEEDARQHRWEAVLETLSPRRAEEYRDLLPYAMLALNAEGHLMSGMSAYPVKGPEDLDMEGVRTREGYYFSSLLSECLGDYNGAVHYIFQSSCHLRHGTSLLTLMQLIRYNIENENYTLVRKYASVLSHNPRNHSRARKIMEVYGRKEDRVPDADCSVAEIVTNDPMVNLGLIHKAGITSDMAAERLAAYMFLQGNIL